MDYADPFDTVVTELRYKLLLWTLDMIRKGLRFNHLIHEKKLWNQIDIDIDFRNVDGTLLHFSSLNNLAVNISTVGTVKAWINQSLVQFGFQI